MKKRAHEKPDNVDFHIRWNIIIKVFEDGFTTIHCVILWIAWETYVEKHMITVHITYYSVQDFQALKEFFCVLQCTLYTLTNTRIGHSEMHQRKQFFMQSSSFGHHFSCARNSTWIKINDFHFTLLCFSDRIKLRYRVTLKIIQWTLTPHSMNAFDWIRVLELILRLVPNKIYDFWLHEWFANQIKIWNESKQRTKQTN